MAQLLEWTLGFHTEDTEADLRFNHIVKCFEADDHVQEIEVSTTLSEPGTKVLIVRFKPGKERPHNRALEHFDKIHAVEPFIRRSRYERLLDNRDIFDNT